MSMLPLYSKVYRINIAIENAYNSIKILEKLIDDILKTNETINDNIENAKSEIETDSVDNFFRNIKLIISNKPDDNISKIILENKLNIITAKTNSLIETAVLSQQNIGDLILLMEQAEIIVLKTNLAIENAKTITHKIATVVHSSFTNESYIKRSIDSCKSF